MNKILLCVCYLVLCVSVCNAGDSNTNKTDNYILSIKLRKITPSKTASAYEQKQRVKFSEGETETLISIKMYIVIGENQKMQVKTKDYDFDASLVIEKKGTAFFGNIECHASANSYMRVKGCIPIYRNKEFILTKSRLKDSIEVLTWELLDAEASDSNRKHENQAEEILGSDLSFANTSHNTHAITK